MHLEAIQLDRAVGAMLGLAAGDVLSAGGFEMSPFGGEHLIEDCGRSLNPEPGEWTDCTAMAIPIAQFLAEGRSLGDDAALADVVDARYPAARAAEVEGSPRARGDESLARVAPVALGYLAAGQEGALARAARVVSSLDREGPDAADASVLLCLTIRHSILTGELDLSSQVTSLPTVRRDRWERLIARAETGQPEDFAGNGHAVEALQGAWAAVRHARGVADTLERAARGGAHSCAIAAIAGALGGATKGGSAVPARWRRLLHGRPGLRTRGLVDLAVLAARGGRPDGSGWPLADRFPASGVDTLTPHPHDDGVLLASLDGLDHLPIDVRTVLSLCRVGRRQTDREQVEFWLVDAPGKNADVDAVLIDIADTLAAVREQGQRVVVHCREARSRTAAVAVLHSVRHLGVPFAEAEHAIAHALPDYEPKTFLLDAVARITGQRRGGERP